jgi:hypothetical protein
MVTFGGIHVNRKFECMDASEKAIAGLYAVGVDSAELWPIFTPSMFRAAPTPTMSIRAPIGCQRCRLNRVSQDRRDYYLRRHVSFRGQQNLGESFGPQGRHLQRHGTRHVRQYHRHGHHQQR